MHVQFSERRRQRPVPNGVPHRTIQSTAEQPDRLSNEMSSASSTILYTLTYISPRKFGPVEREVGKRQKTQIEAQLPF